MYITLKITNAGRDRKTRNDCVVRSIASGLDIPYSEAHEILRKLGRQGGKGTDVHRAWLDAKPYTMRIDPGNGLTLQAFLTLFPEGTYMVEIFKHMLCIVDGIIHDDHFNAYYLNQRILHAWKVDYSNMQGKRFTRKITYNIPGD